MAVNKVLYLFLSTLHLSLALSSYGTEFLVVCPQTDFLTSATEYIINSVFPTANSDLTTISVPLLDVTLDTYITSLQGSSRELSLGHTYMLNGTGISINTILVNSTVDISVYVMSKPDGDGYMAIPIESLGTAYYVVTYCEDDYICQCIVSASQDATQVEIRLSISNATSSIIFNGTSYSNGDVISLTLNSYESLQIRCDSDLTGSLVVANKPIAVYGGGGGSTVAGGEAKGLLMEQLPPISAYGREILTMPSNFVQTVGDYYRIITSKKDTTVQFGNYGRRLFTNEGDWIQIRLTGTNLISSDKPILMMRITQGSKILPTTERPSMMLMIPTEQYLSGEIKVVLPISYTSNNQIIVVSRAPLVDPCLINYVPQSSGWTGVPGSNLYYKYVQGYMADLQYLSKASSRAFAVYYQMNLNTHSSSYTGAMQLNITNPECQPSETGLGDTVDNDCDGEIDEDVCPFNGIPADYVDKDCKEHVFGERDSYGRRFIMAFPQNTVQIVPVSLYVVSAGGSDITVHVTTPLNETVLDIQIIFTLSGVITFTGAVEIRGTTVSNLGILIEASEEIAVYSLSDEALPSPSSGASRLLPLEALGKEYYAVTTCELGLCQITMVAAHPSTLIRVRVNLSNTSSMMQYDGKVYLHGDLIEQLLSQYEVWQLQCDSDITGTRITSDKPISVFSGADHAALKILQQKDQFVEQLPPLVTWGTTNIAVHTPARLEAICIFTEYTCMDTIKIISSEGNTVIHVKTNKNSDVFTYYLNHTGDWTEFSLNTTAFIESNKAIFVAQLLSDNIQHDAGMLTVVPIEQYVSTDIIRVYDSTDFIYEVTIITKSIHNTNILLNATYLTNPNDFPESMSSFTEVVGAGQTLYLNSDNSTFLFGGYVYARKMFSSFIFPLAAFHNLINKPCVVSVTTIGDGVDNDCDGQVDEEPCNGTVPEDIDFDGMFDEDCASPLEISSSSSIESSTVMSSFSGISSSVVGSSGDVSSSASYSNDVSLSSDSLSSLFATYSNDVSMTYTTASLLLASSYNSDVSPSPIAPSNDASSSLQDSNSLIATSSLNLMTGITTSYTLIPNTNTLPSLTILDTSSVYVISSGDSVCSCGCITWSITTTLDPASLVEVTESIKSELTVDVKQVSKTKRKYISVPDPRVSAQTVGYFGVAIISGIFIGIFILDSGAIFKDVSALLKILKGLKNK